MATDDDRAEALRTARAEVRRALGVELEGKASDEFCLLTYRRGRRLAESLVGLETVGGGTPPAAGPTVIEFSWTGEQPPPASFSDQPGLAEAVSALRSAMPEGTAVRPWSAVRQALVTRARTDAYRLISPVYDEIERLSGSMFRPAAELSPMPALVNQVCWLNQTVRTWAGAEVLADVAADPAVSGVDVSRRVLPDADTPNHRAINFPSFQSSTGLTGQDLLIGVSDSEVSLHHPALKGRVVHRRNYTPEQWGNPDSHGTAVAGIAAGDDEQFGGVAPKVVIHNYKVIATNRFANADDFGGALSMQQALEDGVDVLNCSWGVGPAGNGTSREARAADAAWALGMVIVKSAGNRGPGRATMTSPADAAGIIVVGATDVDGREVQNYSSRGPAETKPGPDLVAPGGGPSGFIDCCLVGGGFGNAGVGTSYAAPHVTGLVALLLEREPDLVPDKVRQHLLGSAKPLADVGEDVQGAGLLYAE